MNLLDKAKLLIQFGFRPIRGDSHAKRLESFYGYQAAQYDAYREDFLIGRRELLERIDFPPAARWLDVGCGTGYLLECAAAEARQCERIYLVDLTPSLLEVARQRVERERWSNVEILEADATTLHLDDPLDVVTFSYSLTMIPDWFVAIDRACDLLSPSGLIAVTDFYVARKHTCDPVKHGWLTRHFWPAWFDGDNVSPNADHLDYLRCKFETRWLSQTRTRIPGMPFMRPPCYQFLGSKR